MVSTQSGYGSIPTHFVAYVRVHTPQSHPPTPAHHRLNPTSAVYTIVEIKLL